MSDAQAPNLSRQWFLDIREQVLGRSRAERRKAMALYRLDLHDAVRVAGYIPQPFQQFFTERGIDLSPLDDWHRGVISMTPRDALDLARLSDDFYIDDEGPWESLIRVGPVTGTEHQVPVTIKHLPGGSSWQW